MFTDGQGQRRSFNCLVVGIHESSAPSSSSSMSAPQDNASITGTSMRPGDILIDINNTSIIAKHESQEQNDETAQRYFHQAVASLGQASVPRTIRFFRLLDPRTVTSGRVFTVLTAIETSILIPHISPFIT